MSIESIESKEGQVDDQSQSQKFKLVVHESSKKRPCRDLNVLGPSDCIVHEFSHRRNDSYSQYVLRGFLEFQVPAPARASSSKALHSAGVKSRSSPSASDRTSDALIKKKRKKFYPCEAPYLSPMIVTDATECVSAMLSTAFRCNANHVAVGKMCKDGTSTWNLQQTTRVSIGGPALTSAVQQITNRIIVGLASGLAASLCSHVIVSKPECTLQPSMRDAVEWARGRGSAAAGLDADADAAIWSMPCRHISGVAPRSLTPSDVLATMIDIARRELNDYAISSMVPQSTMHLQLTCNKICNARDGSRLWFSLKLLEYLVKGDFRTHAILEEHGITDFDYALATSLCIYASSLVSNRARQLIGRFESQISTMSKSYGVTTLNSALDDAWNDVGQVSANVPDMKLEDLALLGSARKNIVCARGKYQRTNNGAASSSSAPRLKVGNKRIESLATITTSVTASICAEGSNKGKPADSGSTTTTTTTSLAMVVVGDNETGSEAAETSIPDDSKVRSELKRRRSRASGLSGAPFIKELEMFLCHFADATNAEAGFDDDDGGESIMANCSLKHLISEQVAASRESAHAILKWQLSETGIEITDELLKESESAALHTRSLLLRLLKNDKSACPTLSRWSVGSREYVGIGHRPTGGTLFALTSPAPIELQPIDPCSSVLWSKASMRSKDSYKSSDGRPLHAVVGCAEALAELSNVSTDDQRGVSAAVRAHTHLSEDIETTSASGLTRSVVILSAILPLGGQIRQAVRSVAEEVLDMQKFATEDNFHRLGPTTATGERSLSTRTPSCVPSNPLAVGFNISEAMRFSYGNIAKEQAICLVRLDPRTQTPFTSVVPKLINPNSRPWAIMHIVDVNFEPGEGREEISTLTGNRCVFETPARAAFTVCADSPIPVTKAVEILANEVARESSSGPADGAREDTSSLMQLRAVLLMAGVQCHTVNTFGNACASRNMNTSVENTSRITDPDNHRLLNATVYQAYVTGNSNVEPQFAGTAWHGAYGSVFDCGSVASDGQRAKHIVSDERLPVRPLMMDQDQVNQFSIRYAPYTYATVISPAYGNKKLFQSTPMECWGLPRYLIPGFHLALENLCNAYTSLRKASCTEYHDTVMSIQVLPCSPFTEAVPPIFRGAQWNSFRSNTVAPSIPMGWSTFQADATLPEASILNTPLLNGCRVHNTQSIDNFFENCNTNVSVVLLLASIIDTIAMTMLRLERGSEGFDAATASPEEAMQTLYNSLAAVHRREEGDSNCHGRVEAWRATLAFDALVLINVLAPQHFDVSEFVVLTAYSLAPHAAFKSAARTLSDVPGLSADDLAEADDYWGRLGSLKHEDGFWKSTVRLVTSVRARGTTFHNTIAEMGEAALVFEKWVRSIWHLHSPDGINPPSDWSPLCECQSPSKMTSLDVMGVFVDRPDVPQLNRKRQRGALFGLDYNSMNQVFALLNASHLAQTVVNCARNEGSICLRPSCNALKRDDRGRKPSAKSTSATYDDNDFEASGSIKAREESAKRQGKAWSKNNELLFNLTKRAHFKHEFSGSMRGSTLSLAKHRRNQLEVQAARSVSPDFIPMESKRMRDAAARAARAARAASNSSMEIDG
jgi:hypothetical protein